VSNSLAAGARVKGNNAPSLCFQNLSNKHHHWPGTFVVSGKLSGLWLGVGLVGCAMTPHFNDGSASLISFGVACAPKI
jgi:hypothetical protein